MSDDRPVYVSRGLWRNLFQRYAVHTDHVELPCRVLLHTFRVPLADIVEVGVSPPSVFFHFWGMNLDFATFSRHVYVVRKRGLFRTIKFTPDDPDAFLQAMLDQAARGEA